MGFHSGSSRHRMGFRRGVGRRCSVVLVLLVAVFSVGAPGGSFSSASAAAADRQAGVLVSNKSDASISSSSGSTRRVRAAEVGSFVQQGSKLTGGGEIGAGGFGVQRGAVGGREHRTDRRPSTTAVSGRRGCSPAPGRTWTQQGSKLTGSDETGAGYFGSSVALSADGNTALIGGPDDNSGGGRRGCSRARAATWTQQGSKLTGSDETGAGGVRRQRRAVGGREHRPDRRLQRRRSDVGAAWVFTRSGGIWTQQGAKLTGSDETGAGLLRLSVALSADGNTALIGGPATTAASGRRGCSPARAAPGRSRARS